MHARPARDGKQQQVLRSGRQGPPLPDTDLPQPAGSNFSSNIPLEPGGTDYVENLVRLQAQAAPDDLLHDLGGAAEDPRNTRNPTGQRGSGRSRGRAARRPPEIRAADNAHSAASTTEQPSTARKLPT